jgi:hypothetical protein
MPHQPVRRYPPLVPLITIVIAATVFAGCASSGNSPSSSPITSVTTPDAAAALVIARQPGFRGVGPKNPNLIGQCCWVEAAPSGAGFDVAIVVGWGDCESGCINRHTWHYLVTTTGAISLLSEAGEPVPPGVIGAGVGGSGSGGGGGILPGGSGVEGQALSGPSCPVQTVGDPSCDDRALAGAIVLITDVNGNEVARIATGPDGRFRVPLPSGPYRVVAQPAKGLMGTPGPIDIVVGEGQYATVNLSYDTGIR